MEPSDTGGRGNFVACARIMRKNIFIRCPAQCGCELERPNPLQPSSHHPPFYVASGSLSVMSVNASIAMGLSTQRGDLEEVIGAPFLGFIVGSV